MESLTGVNQKQLWQYANGYKSPRKETSEKNRKGVETICQTLRVGKIAE